MIPCGQQPVETEIARAIIFRDLRYFFYLS